VGLGHTQEGSAIRGWRLLEAGAPELPPAVGGPSGASALEARRLLEASAPPELPQGQRGPLAAWRREDEAVINRMGLGNEGSEAVAARLKSFLPLGAALGAPAADGVARVDIPLRDDPGALRTRFARS